MFGAYNGAAPWQITNRYFGGEVGGYGSALFSLKPSSRFYPATGWNENLLYLGNGCTSGINPNGVAWGGQIDSFGLFIESSMDSGHSCPSATFNNLALHEGGAKTFAIDVVEVWSPAVAESDAEDELGGSGGGVLNNDKFAADKNILMAAGLYQAHHERA